jgi:hypothetical protein
MVFGNRVISIRLTPTVQEWEFIYTIHNNLGSEQMRYFTRQLHDSSRIALAEPIDDGFEARFAEIDRKSVEVSLRYLNYLREHDTQLTDAVKKLISCELHDSRITHIQKDEDSIKLQLDTRHAPWINAASIRIVFFDIHTSLGLDNLVGQDILHEELYIYDDNTFEFSALCTKSEFSLRFGDVEITLT